MSVLIERGHLFIAQPPLYKVRKGKQEHYVKDDDELIAYLTAQALDGAELFVNPDAPPITGAPLEDLVKHHQRVEKRLERMHRVSPEALTRPMVHLASVTAEDLADEARMKAWTDAFGEYLGSSDTGTAQYAFSVEADPEHNVFLPRVDILEHGVRSILRFPQDFFLSAEYRDICSLGERLQHLLEAGAYVKRGEKTQPVRRFEEALAWLMKESRKGQDIQRYKGLGEMNPEQLWDTTMNPETRRMLRVTVEDAVSADRVFTTLMGDEVEPRRAFIESNALSVANLDV